MEEKEFVEYIGINDSLHNIVETVNNDKFKKAFVLCKEEIANCNVINIKGNINKYLPNHPISLNKAYYLILDTKVDNIKYLKMNNKEFFIVNIPFLLKIGFNYSLNDSTISYYKYNSNTYLYFNYEFELFKIVKNNQLHQPTKQMEVFQNPMNINLNQNIVLPNNINQNVNNENLKLNILNCLILLYANKKEIIRLSSPVQSLNYNLENYTLVNKSWIDTFKATFYYDEIKKIISYNENLFNTYNDYINNLNYFHSNSEIKKIKARIIGIPDILSSQTKFIPGKKYLTNNSEVLYTYNFEIINNSLFNLLKDFIDDKNEINNYQLEYKIFAGNLTFYFQLKKYHNIFYVYKYDNNNKSYIFVAFIKFQNDFLFQEEINKLLQEKNFSQYILSKKGDLNLNNQIQKLDNSGILVLTDEFKKYYQINQMEQINEMNQMNQMEISQMNQLLNNPQINQLPQKLRIKEQSKNQMDSNFFLFKNFKKFNESLVSLKDLNIHISDFNNIDNYISLRQLIYLPVFLI